MKSYFEKYKEYLKFILTNNILINFVYLIDNNKLRTLFYRYGIEVFLILFEYYHDNEEYEICAKFKKQLDIMNKHEGKMLPTSMAQYIERLHLKI